MLLAFLRKVLETETLPPPPESVEVWRPRPSKLRLLVAPEELGSVPDDGPPPRHSPWLRMLFAPETLPDEPTAPPRRRAGTRWLPFLFAAEPLPEAPAVQYSPRSGRWLQWLFAPEKIDKDQR